MGRWIFGAILGVGFLFVLMQCGSAVDFVTLPSPTNRTLSSLYMVNENDGWAVGYSGTIIRWNGTDWRYSPSPVSSILSSVFMLGRDEGWIVGGFGTILSWDGSYWAPVDSPTGWGIHSVSMVSSGDGWAVGYRGAILRWDGESWRLELSPTWDSLNSIQMLDEDEGWAVGNKGTIVHWNGIEWSKVASPTTTNLFSVSMVTPSAGWAVGRAGTILRWDGESWNLVASPTANDLGSVHMVSEDDGWAVGGDGNPLHWDGARWELASSPTEKFVNCIFMLDADNGWAVGNEGTLLRWTGAAHGGRITVDPPSIDFGAVPVDYPTQWNITTISNNGTEPLRVESVTLTEDGEGVFSFVGSIYEEKFFSPSDSVIGRLSSPSGSGIGDPASHLGPYVLDPGEYVHVWASYKTVTSEVEDYSGVIEIVSDDPFDPVIEVQLSASGATNSMASTLSYVETQVAQEQHTFPFTESIHLNAAVVSCDVFSEHNVEDFMVKASEDMRGIVVGGIVEDPDFHAKVIVEVDYTNSSEKLAVIDIVVPPYPPPGATISTCDSFGDLVDYFDDGEAVYVTGTGYAPSTEYSIGLVPDSELWLTGMNIRGLPGTAAKVSSNSEGVIPPTLLWDNPDAPGEYDIVLDIMGDGIYDGGIDPLDNSRMGSTGGFAIHELGIFPLLLVGGLSIPALKWRSNG